MKKTVFAIAVLTGSLLWLSATTSSAQNVPASNVTLYSPFIHPGVRYCLNFQTGLTKAQLAPCDLQYGTLRVAEEWDWFQSSARTGDRSVIKDLGAHQWSDELKIPVVTPLAQLKPGEHRRITVDASGANGADGKLGAKMVNGANGADAEFAAAGMSGARIRDFDSDPDGILRRALPPVQAPEPRAKHPSTPKVDPLFVKASPGHMYLIHVVDDLNDFYALFRVEALKRGDKCTIAWKLIPAPAAQTTRRK